MLLSRSVLTRWVKEEVVGFYGGNIYGGLYYPHKKKEVLWWDFCGGTFVVRLLWWDFCGGTFVVGLLWWDEL